MKHACLFFPENNDEGKSFINFNVKMYLHQFPQDGPHYDMVSKLFNFFCL
jgi:hypothetical protein